MDVPITLDSAGATQQIPLDSAVLRSLTTPWLAISLGLFSKVSNARSLNEQPEDLTRSTTNQSYWTSELLHQVFPGDRLQQIIASQIGECVTITCLQEVAYILHEPDQACRCTPGSHSIPPTSDISQALERAVRGYDWQGRTTRFGRCHYLMGLLKEILQNLDVDTPDFWSKVLRDESAAAACNCIVDNHIIFGTSAKLIVGDWAAHRFIRQIRGPVQHAAKKASPQVLESMTAARSPIEADESTTVHHADLIDVPSVAGSDGE